MEAVAAAVEEAIRVVANRDAVFFDPVAGKWTSSIPSKAPIRTAFDKVTCMFVRSYDGMVICSHPCGTAYLSSSTVTKDSEGNFVDVAFVSREAPDPDAEAAGYAETERKDRPSTVDLRGCMLDHAAMARLTSGLSGNCFVTTLSLSGNQLRDSEMSLLASALELNGCLTTLHLNYNCIGTLGSTLLATALADNTHVRVLDLEHNRIGKDGVPPWLGKTLRTNAALRELRLAHNAIGDCKASELLAALGPKVVTDDELLKTQIHHRRRTEMPTATLPSLHSAAIADAFNTTLTTLLLGNTGVSDAAAEHIAHVLTANHTLTHLDISSNAFSATGNAHIAIGLKHNTSLRVLDYSDNRMAEHAGLRVVHALEHHPALATVLLQDCFGGSDIAAALAALVRATATLTKLDVSHCALEPPGVVELYRALGEDATVENLHMVCTGIRSDQAVEIFAQCVAQNRALRVLDLSYNEITLRGCKLLRDAVATHGVRLLLSLEGNSGEKRSATGVTISGGLRFVRSHSGTSRKRTSAEMEQYLLQVPRKLAQDIRQAIAGGDMGKVEMISGADNKHFKLMVNGKEYPSKIAQLPCILETHKTYDDNFFYKSGEIGQIFIVTDKDDEMAVLEQQDEVPNGITPPNTNVVKRKYEKTKRHTPFPKNDVARVEEDLVKIIQGGVIEDVQEELVDFYDWMVDSEHPNGIVVTDELELIRQHPEYLELSSSSSSTDEPPEKQAKLGLTSSAASDSTFSAVNTPIVTDVGSEGESMAGQESAQRSPAFASPALSPDDDKDVDDLEDDILGGMDVVVAKPAEPTLAPAPVRTSYKTDAAYLRLLPIRDKLQRSLRDAERDVSEYSAKVTVNSNIVVMKRVKQLLETAQTQRDEIAAELDKIKKQIADFEST